MSDRDDLGGVGFDVTGLSIEELAARGVVLARGRAIVDARDPAWITHSEAAARFPRYDEVDRASARQAAGQHFARTGSLEGLRLSRSFPCLGTLRVTDDAPPRPVAVECDLCGQRFAVRRKDFEADGAPSWAPAPADPPRQETITEF